ncbi:MAG: adenine phosphoribosyltransferase [SAR202 cluster bacterium Io17-Chloro-G1]|nr:MAG: adenine phosphoribosyltransferase [SAR202 cluster bacterium Io17-Chloro-G1]
MNYNEPGTAFRPGDKPLNLKDYIRDVPDFPTPGILFRDITPLLKNTEAFRSTIEMFAERYTGSRIDAIVGIESRGFMFAAPLCHSLGIPFVPIRKLGKLPYRTHTVSYELEYGSDAVEVHVDALSGGDRVLIVDDLLATGGTLAASTELIEQAGAVVAGLAIVIELDDLGGRNMLGDYDIFSLVHY